MGNLRRNEDQVKESIVSIFVHLSPRCPISIPPFIPQPAQSAQAVSTGKIDEPRTIS